MGFCLFARFLVVAGGRGFYVGSECARAITLVAFFDTVLPSASHRDPGLIGLLGSPLYKVCGAFEKLFTPPRLSLTFSPSYTSRTRCTRPPTQGFYSVIVDGVHCHPASVRIAYMAHPAGCVLVTDAMGAMGLPPGRHKLGSLEVDVHSNVMGAIHEQKAVIAGTDILAGSVVSLDTCVRNFRAFTGCTAVEALEAASLHPALALGLEQRKGTLNFGADADIVVLDDELVVKALVIGGRPRYSSLPAILVSPTLAPVTT